MKLSILLVDDEPKVLRGLKTIIDRAEENWEVTGECKNGADALDVITKSCPDVVITDIKMPGMSGLELVEKAKAIVPELKFIILSGYPDFKYAQQAIRLETANYILKPPDYKEILKSIKKVEADKLESNARKEEEEKLKSIKEAALQPMKDKLFFEMIYRTDLYGGIRDKAGLDELDVFYNKFALFLIKVDNLSCFSFDLDDERLKRLAVFRRKLQAIVFNRMGCLADFYDGTFCCFFNVEGQGCVYLKGFAREIQDELSQDIGESITIGISRTYSNPDMINRAYMECLIILRNKVFYEKNSIIYIDEVRADKSAEGYPLELERKYIEALRFGDHKRAGEVLAKIIDRVMSISKGDPVAFRNLILELLIVAARNLLRTGLPSQLDIIQMNGIANKLNYLDNIDDIKVMLFDYTNSVADYFSSKNKQGCRKVINDIKIYIKNNYFKDISLRQIAGEFFMNESYLSDLFKKETGISFTSYLTNERIGRAKELLKQADLKIQDISDMVGYSNSRYFNSVFKKQTGLTPFEYRERVTNYE